MEPRNELIPVTVAQPKDGGRVANSASRIWISPPRGGLHPSLAKAEGRKLQTRLERYIADIAVLNQLPELFARHFSMEGV